jgi:hypothetical protein
MVTDSYILDAHKKCEWAKRGRNFCREEGQRACLVWAVEHSAQQIYQNIGAVKFRTQDKIVIIAICLNIIGLDWCLSFIN